VLKKPEYEIVNHRTLQLKYRKFAMIFLSFLTLFLIRIDHNMDLDPDPAFTVNTDPHPTKRVNTDTNPSFFITDS